MKIARLVFFAVTMLAAIAARAAPGTTAPQNVVVVNPSTQPVPVQQQGPVSVAGSVSVVGPVTVAGPVEVVSATPLPVSGTVQGAPPRRFRIGIVVEANGIDWGEADADLPNLVPGTRIVLETMSALCNLPAGETMAAIAITARNGGETYVVRGSSRAGTSSVTPGVPTTSILAEYAVFANVPSATTAVYFVPPSHLGMYVYDGHVGAAFRRASATGNASCIVTLDAHFEDVPL